jgi:hypothetical protein
MHGRGAIYLTGVNEKKLDTVEGIFDEGRYIGKGKESDAFFVEAN